jgi:hypothetical protein
VISQWNFLPLVSPCPHSSTTILSLSATIVRQD